MTDKNQAKKMGINIIQSQQEKNPLFDMLLKNFQQTIKDGQVSLSAIKMLLGFNESMHNISGYELTWTGKGLANALYSEPCQKQFKLQESFTPQTSASKHPNNAIIIGDNLDALKLLKSAYSEKIKMIYIDPPYNTQNNEFIYADNFRKDYQKILREVGLMEIDENGKEIESESLKFFKNTQGSGTHSGWLSFMLPRLKLARDLLKEDGVIFISIDDNECAQLKLLCDEIFGEGNFVAQFIWHSKNKPSGNTTEDKTIDTRTEYIFCYQKYNFKANKHENTKEELEEKGYILKDEYFETRGHYKLTPLMRSCSASSFQYIESLDYEIQAPDGTWFKNHQNIKKEKSYRYTWSKKLFDFGNQNGFIEFQKTSDGFWCAYRKMYELCAIDNKKLQIIYRKSGNAYSNLITNLYSDIGANEVRNIFNGEKIFSYPKPTKLINRLIELSTNEGDIILDFFAGSGTTVHAVMELNAEDKGNREFILVQIDEEIKEDESAYDFCKKELKSAKPIISDITIERVKRAAQKIIESSKDSGLDLGFKVYTLEDKAQITNDKEEITLFNHSILTPFDKALNLALQCGKTLNQPLEIIIKDKLYQCEDAYFCIVCDEEVREYLAKSKNEMIFLDGYEEIDLQAFLNLNASFKERLSVVY
ncbi:site-specific DNA-methyltransferase [Helicobacter pylori]|nr:site-specific DNA-methyltransferase [Helicobacter pylori]